MSTVFTTGGGDPFQVVSEEVRWKAEWDQFEKTQRDLYLMNERAEKDNARLKVQLENLAP